MARSPESYQYVQTNPNTRPDMHLNPSTGEIKKDGKKKSATALRGWGAFNVGTGLLWTGAAVVTGGAAIPIIMASVDGLQAGASFAGAHAIDKKKQKEANNGKYMSAEAVMQQRVLKKDLQPGKPVGAKTVKELANA
jgi:hypothetical protein